MYWKDRSSAWGGKKVFLARSGQLRSRRFPSTPLLLTQQKETEFSNLFRVSFANLQKQGEIFPCSPASCWGSSCQHASVAANSSTRRDPKFSRRCRRAAAGTRGGSGAALLRRQPRGVIRTLTSQLLHSELSKKTPCSEPSLNQ